MPNDVLPPADPPAAVVVTTPEERYRICDMCGCKLTRHGEIVAMGEKAKRFQRHDKTIEELNEAIADRDREISTLKDELRELKVNRSPAEPATKESPFLV